MFWKIKCVEKLIEAKLMQNYAYMFVFMLMIQFKKLSLTRLN